MYGDISRNICTSFLAVFQTLKLQLFKNINKFEICVKDVSRTELMNKEFGL